MAVMNLFAGQQWRNRHREQTYGHGGEERREKARGMERVTWKLTIPYVKQIANGNLLYGSGDSNRGPVTIWRSGLRRKMGGSFGGKGHGCTCG